MRESVRTEQDISFSKTKAEREGLAYVGQICTEHATNEMKHAKVFYDFITDNGTERVPNIEFTAGYPFKAGTLNEEIKSVAQDELNQATTIYPDFAQVAKDEGFHDVAQAFELIARGGALTLSRTRTDLRQARKGQAVQQRKSNSMEMHGVRSRGYAQSRLDGMSAVPQRAGRSKNSSRILKLKNAVGGNNPFERVFLCLLSAQS